MSTLNAMLDGGSRNLNECVVLQSCLYIQRRVERTHRDHRHRQPRDTGRDKERDERRRAGGVMTWGSTRVRGPGWPLQTRGRETIARTLHSNKPPATHLMTITVSRRECQFLLCCLKWLTLARWQDVITDQLSCTDSIKTIYDLLLNSRTWCFISWEDDDHDQSLSQTLHHHRQANDQHLFRIWLHCSPIIDNDLYLVHIILKLIQPAGYTVSTVRMGYVCKIGSFII